MSTDLENDVAAALRFRAGEVPDTPCPPLGADRVATGSPRRWLVPVAAAAAVAGLAAAAVVLLPGTGGDNGTPGDSKEQAAAPTDVYYSRTLSASPGGGITQMELWQGQGRTDPWQQKGVGGTTIKDGRVVPDNSIQLDYPVGGECYPAANTTEEACTNPGSWFNPTPDFLAGASRDATVVAQQLHHEAVAEEERRTAPDGDFSRSADTYSPANLAYLELNYLRGTLAANGVPDDLVAVLRQVIAGMPGIQVTEDVANLTGVRGTGYSLPDFEGKSLTVIFDADGDYIGSPTQAVVHGLAPALGAAPSRLFD